MLLRGLGLLIHTPSTPWQACWSPPAMELEADPLLCGDPWVTLTETALGGALEFFRGQINPCYLRVILTHQSL